MEPDSSSVRFDQGLRHLAEHLNSRDRQAMSRAIDALQEAAAGSPSNAAFRLALGFLLDAGGRPHEALVQLREAARLEPGRVEAEILCLTLMAELGEEAEAMRGIEAAATRQGVDLDALRRELDLAGFPVDARTILQNGFPSARNWIHSWLLDEIERVARSSEPPAAGTHDGSEIEGCLRMQEELEEAIDWSAVPEPLRALVPWAARLGVGDDVCRPVLFSMLSASERSELEQMVETAADAVHSWLDGFGSRWMPPEAAAFLYLLLGVEEME